MRLVLELLLGWGYRVSKNERAAKAGGDSWFGSPLLPPNCRLGVGSYM